LSSKEIYLLKQRRPPGDRNCPSSSVLHGNATPQCTRACGFKSIRRSGQLIFTVLCTGIHLGLEAHSDSYQTPESLPKGAMPSGASNKRRHKRPGMASPHIAHEAARPCLQMHGASRSVRVVPVGCESHYWRHLRCHKSHGCLLVAGGQNSKGMGQVTNTGLTSLRGGFELTTRFCARRAARYRTKSSLCLCVSQEVGGKTKSNCDQRNYMEKGALADRKRSPSAPSLY